MSRVLIVGGGITGAVASSLMKCFMPENCYVAVWDKAKFAGGRLNTNIYRRDNNNCSVDLGAQYISPSPQEYTDHASFYSELEGAGLLKPMTCRVEGDCRKYEAGTRHFVTPRGMRSVVEHFLTKSGADLHLGRTLSELAVDGSQFVANTLENGSERFDSVVLTMPVPQILQLPGIIPTLLDRDTDIRSSLQRVEFSSRYTLGVYLDKGARAGVDWGAKYFDDPIIRYIAVDTTKRNSGTAAVNEQQSLVVHSTVPFGLEMLNSNRDSVCSNIVLPRLRQLMPELPKPAYVKMHRWRYSQVYKPYPGSPGAVVLNTSPLLVLGGDSFTYSKFDGCLVSARMIAECVRISSRTCT